MSLDADIAALFPGLGSPDQRQAWEALARKALRGEGWETLVRRTPDGLEVKPLYTAEDSVALPVLGRSQSAGERPWDLRTRLDGGDLADANRRALEDLSAGGGSLLLNLDPSSDDRLPVVSAADLQRVLDGVLLDIAPVALDAGFAGPEAADWLAEAAKGGPAAPLAFHLDPLGAFALAGRSPGPIDAHVEWAAKTAARHAETYARATLFLANGRAVHEAGGTRAEELAVTLAAAAAYAKALATAGLTVEQALKGVILGVSVDGEYFDSLVALRAARLLWNRMAEACGAAVPARIEARSSRRMLTAQDAWTNLLRLTAAGFAAAVGGAEAIVLDPFTQPLGPASPLARRQARNIQLLLMEESHLGGAVDPASGAWALERQTLDLAQAAWGGFQAIEAAGGLVEALEEGLVASAVARSREAMQEVYASGARTILGVTRHADAQGTSPPLGAALPHGQVAAPALPGADDECPPLTPVRWSAPFEKEA